MSEVGDGNPFSITCPHCGQGPGQRCRNGSGMVMQPDKVHSKRRKAAAGEAP